MNKALLCLVILSTVLSTAKAQKSKSDPTPTDSTQLYMIVLDDENEYVGHIVETTDTYILFQTEKLGQIKIPTSSIKKQIKVNSSQQKGNEIWIENLQSTRYFWQPNGYGLKPGEGYYQNIWIFFNQASYGVTDWFSVSAGMVPLFLFGGLPTPMWVVPKFSIPIVENKLNLGAGFLMGSVIGASGSNFGIPFGVATYGSRNNNLSLGLGYAVASGELSSSPLITFSGMVRTGKRGYLVTENYIFTGDNSFGGLLMLGGRTVWNKLSLDYGGVIPLNDEAFFIIPWLGFSIPF